MLILDLLSQELFNRVYPKLKEKLANFLDVSPKRNFLLTFIMVLIFFAILIGGGISIIYLVSYFNNSR